MITGLTPPVPTALEAGKRLNRLVVAKRFDAEAV